MQTDPPAETWRRRPRLRITLRVLIVVVLVVGGGLGWIIQRARVQRDAVAAIERSGGRAYSDWQLERFTDSDGAVSWRVRKPPGQPPWPAWLIANVGPDLFGTIKRVETGPREVDVVMAQVGKLNRLEALVFGRGGWPSDAGIAHLRGMTHLRQLTWFPDPANRNNPGITSAGVQVIGTLTGLEGVHPPFFPWTDADVAALRNLTELRVLVLKGGDLSDASLEVIKGMSKLWLLSISFTGDRMTTAGLSNLRGIRGMKRLEIGGPGITDLTPIRDLTALESFGVLNAPELDDAGLAPIAHFTRLEQLWLGNTKVSDAGLEHLKGLSQLEWLLIHRATHITDAGIKNITGLKRLTNLGLTGSPITDEGIAQLVALPALDRLDLQGAQLTDSGLTRLGRLPNLRNLFIRNTRVTDAGVAEFQKANPLVTVRYGAIGRPARARTAPPGQGLRAAAPARGAPTPP